MSIKSGQYNGSTVNVINVNDTFLIRIAPWLLRATNQPNDSKSSVTNLFRTTYYSSLTHASTFKGEFVFEFLLDHTGCNVGWVMIMYTKVLIPPVFYYDAYLKIKSCTGMICILFFLMKYTHIKRYLYVYWTYFHSFNKKFRITHFMNRTIELRSLFDRFHEFSMIFGGFWL